MEEVANKGEMRTLYTITVKKIFLSVKLPKMSPVPLDSRASDTSQGDMLIIQTLSPTPRPEISPELLLSQTSPFLALFGVPANDRSRQQQHALSLLGDLITT